ncbi:MAG: hypothetical protein A2252_05280 [Elusimicrobia bacterium RIFOXYA2_FULL_39_19]|nr:MAG: hypothetical protein A2252_05280 [Elusimicrobia bacterium RIFOXYA2_FULL_39_19]
MQSFLELAKKRFSARSYIDKPVEKEKINQCLEAARLAPSACNSQPWEFIVVDEPELKNRLADSIFSGTHSTNSFAKKAPVLVFVVSDKGSFISKVGAFMRDTRFYLIDIGITAEHFVLQAAELGLGTCWLGWFNENAAKKILKIPKNKRLDIVISVGYTEKTAPEKNRKTFDKLAKFNSGA